MTIIVRGRWAWILAILAGIGMIIGAVVSGNMFFLIPGIAFAVFGIIFLILSFVTGGRTD